MRSLRFPKVCQAVGPAPDRCRSGPAALQQGRLHRVCDQESHPVVMRELREALLEEASVVSLARLIVEEAVKGQRQIALVDA